LAFGGCASREEIRGAITDVNLAFQADYEKTLSEKGTRTFKVRRGEAFVALHAALARLGMRVIDQDPALGTLAVEAAAPRPLDAAEWRKAADADLPRLREIARRHVGWVAETIRFEPEGIDILVNATLVESGGATEISLTTRMREVAPPTSGLPRREYPPPTAVRIALDKIWAQTEAELRAALRMP
jgi:hypothetical protein